VTDNKQEKLKHRGHREGEQAIVKKRGILLNINYFVRFAEKFYPPVSAD